MRAGWNLLQEQTQSRQKQLAAAHEIHRFIRNAHELLGRLKVQDLVSWNNAMKETICSEEPAHSVSGAEALILKHNEHKSEIKARVIQVHLATDKLGQSVDETHSIPRGEGGNSDN